MQKSHKESLLLFHRGDRRTDITWCYLVQQLYSGVPEWGEKWGRRKQQVVLEAASRTGKGLLWLETEPVPNALLPQGIAHRKPGLLLPGWVRHAWCRGFQPDCRMRAVLFLDQ